MYVVSFSVSVGVSVSALRSPLSTRTLEDFFILCFSFLEALGVL